MSEYAEQDIEKTSTPPLVQDCTHPDASTDDDAGANTGAVVAVVGTPSDGSFPAYSAEDGYFRIARILTDAGTGEVLVDAVTGDVLLDLA